MFNGLKAKRQLALYVAFGLSTGGGLLFSGTPAYAADVTISSSDTAHSGGVNGTTETGNKDGNNVTIGESGAAGPTINGDVVGGYATAGDATNNTVTINSISLGSGKVIYGGKSAAGAATGNIVTIAGGTLNSNNKIIGGEGTASSTSNGNIVNLGDENGNFSANLNRAEIWGTSYGGQVQANDSDKIKGNTLNVNASGIRLEMVRNFQKINFNLTKSVTADSTMLTMDTGNFGLGYGKAFDWENFSLTGKENDTDKTKYGRIGNINLLFAYSGSDMKIGNYTTGGRKGTTGDYEYHMEADGGNFMGSRSSQLIKANVDRFKNADATVNNAAGSYVYGGYSSLGNTTTNNKIKVTNTNNTSLNVIGGRTDGTGDSTNNHVTIADTSTVNYVFGGWATKADSKAEGNSATIESGSTTKNFVYGGFAKNTAKTNKVTLGGTAEKIVYGGYADVTAQGNVVTVTGSAEQNVYGGWVNGTGTAEGNEVHIEGGTLKQFVTGGIGKVDSTVTGNKVFMTGGTVTRNIIGGETSGTNGKATKNIIEISGGTVNGFLNGGFIAGGTATENEVAISGDTTTVKQSVNGGYDTQSGTLTKNKVTISGGTVEQFVYGGYSNDSGTVTGNEVMFSNGTVKKNINGGYALTGGTVTGNKVTISGGTLEQSAYAGYSHKYGTVTGNILTITGGTIKGTVYGGAGGNNDAAYTAQTFAANGNTVTIAGGTFSENIFGGYSWKSNGTTTDNTVNLGDNTHTDLSGATLSASDIYGGNKAATGNTLNVNAKNITAKSVNHFENYKFKLNSATTFDDTMLTVTDVGDFAGTGVDLNKITVDSTGLSADYLGTQHGIKRMTLLKRSNDTDTLTFANYAAREAATATETHEFGFVTNNGTGTANALMLEASRFKGSNVTYDGTTPTFGGEVYGGFSRYGHTTTGNTLTVTGKPTSGTPLKYAYGGKNEGAAGAVKDNTATLELPNNNSAIKDVYGGKITNAANAGEVSGNIVNMKRGTVEYAVGGQTDGTGAAKNNTVNLTGGTVTKEIYGGLSEKGAATGNTVTISGGTVGSYTPADVYGGKKLVLNAGSSTSNNTVNLGAEDGSYTADLTKANIHGDNSTDGAVNNNTLNVRGKNITVNSVDNFDKYKFTLNNNIKDGDTMLTLKNGGFGREIDFANNFGLDTSKLTGKPTGLITLVKSATGTLKFKSGYVPRDLGSTDNVEYFVGTDTGEREGSSVIMGYNIFKGNTWTYDGTNPPNAKELFGGVSYNNHTTESNTLTITNTSTTEWVGKTYGGKTAGRTGGAKNNRVVVENTGAGRGITNVYGGAVTNEKNATGTVTGNSVTLKNGRTSTVYGGYTRGKGAVGGSANGEGNAVTLENGVAGDVYGGAIDNSDSTAAVTGNKVTIQNGTYNRLYGGHTKGKGAAQNNEVTISGGTSSDDVHGGYTHDGGAATGNGVTLTGGTVTGTIYGGYTNNGGDATGNTVTLTGGKVTDKVYAGYADGGGATTGNTVNLGNGTGFSEGADFSGTSIYGGNKADVTGNTLNVKGKNMTVKTAGKFENYTFYLGNDVKDGDTLLTFAQAGGFDGDAADWSKITLDADKLHAWSAGKQRTNTITLLNAAGMTFTGAANQRLLSVHDGMEYGVRTDNVGSATASKIFLEANRFKNGVVDFTAATTGEALGGISHFGNTTEHNTLTVKSLAAGAHSAYGGKTMGAAGGSIKNTVTVTGTGAGTLTNVYGGYVDKAANSGDVTGNRVTLTGGTVTGAVYGGYTKGSGATTGNTVNIGADPTTLKQGDTSTLAAGTNLTNAEIYGGNKGAAGNTLNVTVKDAAAKKAQNFEKYTFYLTNSVAADKPKSGKIEDAFTKTRGTMLSLADGFDGQTVDWNKVTVDTSKLSADKTLGAITLMKSTAANKLKFSNYAAKNHAVSGDYEVVQRTDTTDTGTTTVNATTVLIDVNRFRNGNVTYDGVNPNAKTYAGVSYGGNTAEKNTMTLTGIASGKTVKYLSGGRSEGAAGGAVNNTVNLVGTGAGTLEEVYGGYIGKTTNSANATGNTVNIAGGTVAKNIYAGYTNGTGKTTGNIVNIGYMDEKKVFHAVADGTKVIGTIYGGNKSAEGNVLNVRGAITAGQIANFERLNFTVNKDTAGKTLLTLNGGAATSGLDWKKLTAQVGTTDLPTKSYAATRVTLMANEQGIEFTNYDKAKELVAGEAYEFSVDRASDGKSVYADGYRFKDNKTASYAASDGTHDLAWGGRSEQGHAAEGNVLTVTGGTITDTAYGGTSRKGAAKKNQLIMRGGEVQTLRGGFGASASDNTVDVFGGTIKGDVYGGHATAGAAERNTVNLRGGVTIGGTIHGGAGTSSVGNTLAVHSFGAQAKDFANVQNLHFYLPAGTTAAEKRSMLTLTNTGETNIKGLHLGVGIAGDAKAFRPGDAVSLLKVGGTLTTDDALKNVGKDTMKASQGSVLDYTLSLAKRGENELIATVEKVEMNARSKSPVETRAAASAMINAGADLLTNAGMTAAAEAANAVVSAATVGTSPAAGETNAESGYASMGAADTEASAAAAAGSGFQLWAAQGGSSVRLNSGSYVDAKGWNLNVGFARANKMGDATLTYGPFVEYGRGTYDSYLDDGTHGSGKMSYIGGGMMAKLTHENGRYVEGSVRAGRVRSDYTGSGDAAALSYDNSNTYCAGHIGFGQEWKLAGGDRIEGYAKYFYSHQGGSTTKLRSGAEFDFGGVDSHRLRVGARYTHADSANSEVYAGLAYEYEFNGDATAIYQGYSTPSPSLGGGTGILELGYRFAPKDGRVSYGVNLMGMTGQREGIAGGAQVTWAF